MNVLSCFDGMSCAQIALERAGIEVDNYYASEVNKSAIKVTQANYPNTIQLGDINTLDLASLPKIDLVIGGSPCQDFSILKANRKGLDGEKSKLFYTFLKIKNELNPEFFLLENVKMRKDSYEKLNDYLGVDGVLINSSLVSFQARPRYYWTNIDYGAIPLDKRVTFQDYKQTRREDILHAKTNKTPSRERMWNNGEKGNNIGSRCPNITRSDKIGCLTRKQDRSPNSGLVEFEGFCRYLTRREMENAQTVPEGYTDCVSYNQSQDILGNGFTVDVIAHILKGMKS